NGDGNSDLAGSDFRAFLWTGHAGIWLGNANPNGLFDLRISSPSSSPDQQFGMTLAAGDFNDDGYSDLAIAAPHSISSGALHYPGYVYIFGGNTQFVTNEDLLSIPEPDSIEMNYYPNPINGKARQINFRVAGKMPDKIHEAEFTIHNIKGQKVERISYDITKLKSGEGVLNTSKLIPGVYLITLWVDGKAINREKIAIK
ncbi:MAG: FG-GAP repeat protein, partial [Candidatus Cloacimonetes bacterium]|nr:FG-GAP repeat protein [Candidatus Cloacimonadota bacterium]